MDEWKGDGVNQGEDERDDDDDDDDPISHVSREVFDAPNESVYDVYSSNISEIEKSDEEKALKIFNKIMDECRASNKPFVDPDFPHNQISLGEQSWSDSSNVWVNFSIQELIWLRPDDIPAEDSQKWVVIRDDLQPSDIVQGKLGDCWFVCALALIAERPDILEKILLTKEYNPMGVYQVRLCIDGKWEIQTIDDFFPCHQNSWKIAFTTSRKSQLWVSLLEKALAKALGTYSQLSGGWSIEGLSILTGASCYTISLRGNDVCRATVWAKLLSANESGFLMGCSCGCVRQNVNHDNREEYERKGLMVQHAYSILDVQQEGLLQLSNHLGRSVWNGAWSDNWIGWPADLREELIEQNDRAQEGGTFWISFDDFLVHFDSVDNWSEIRVTVPVGEPIGEQNRALKIIVKNDTEVCIDLYQPATRTTSDRFDLTICVHKISSNGHLGKLVKKGSMERERNFVTTGDVFLQEGHYFVVCHSSGLSGQKQNSTLVVRSSRPLFGEQLQCGPQMIAESLNSSRW